jgi:aspartate/methionine/tyrosine aminotransferase
LCQVPNAVFSQRTAWNLTPNELTRALESARASGRPLLDLTVSNPTQAGLRHAAAALSGLSHPRGLRYVPHPFGAATARQAVARTYAEQGAVVSAERICLTASTSEAYSFLFKLLCDPGDEVLVPEPSYPLFEHLAGLDGVRLVPYRVAYDGTWYLDVPSLRSAVSPRTRAILVVSPNNPTGNYLKRRELEELASLKLPLLADEVFAPYAFGPDPERVTSVLGGPAPLAFALGGLSKLAALPQLKLAWIAVDGAPSLVSAAVERLEVIADTYLSVGTPVQLALEELLAASRGVEHAIRERTRANLARLRAGTAGTSVSLLRAEGGWYAVLRLPNLGVDWCRELLEKDGVYVQPGWFYDFGDDHHVVLSLLTQEEEFERGARLLLERVAST